MITDEILNRAKKHYSEILSKPLHYVEVPEWSDENGEPTKVYFRAENNLKMDQEVAALHSQGKNGEAAAMALIQRARYEDGTKMFKPSHMLQLSNNVSSQVIIRIIDEMAKITQENSLSDDEIEKN